MGSVVQILYAGDKYRIDNATYAGNQKIYESGNKAQAAEASLAEFSRSLANQTQQENAGKQYNASISQIASQLDTRSTLNLNTSLQASAALGAIQSRAAAAGVGGSSVQLLDQVTELQRNTQQEEQTQATNRYDSSATRNMAQTFSAQEGNLNFTQTRGNFNYTQSIAPSKPSGRLGALIGVAVATYFGGPQAGQAAADSTTAAWKAQNGDYDGAAKLADQSMSNYVGAAQSFGQRGGQSWASAAFGYNDGTGPTINGGGTNGSGTTVNYGTLANNYTDGSSNSNWWSGSSSNSSFFGSGS